MLKLFKPVNNCFIVDRLAPRSEHDLFGSAVYFIIGLLFISLLCLLPIGLLFISLLLYIYLFARSIKLLNQIMADT